MTPLVPLELLKKILKVTYPRDKPTEYFGDFISAIAENRVFFY